jgi:hypothetical protein
MGFDDDGSLTCGPDCQIDLPDSSCKAVCGNGHKEPSEDCDGTVPSGSSCTTVGTIYTGGSLKCGSNCKFDTSACQVEQCGNAIAEGDEECDGTDFRGKPNCTDHFANATGGTVSCTSDCRLDGSNCQVQCGNGKIDSDEECDGSVFSSAYSGKSCSDFPFPFAAFPFNNRVNYAGGALACNGCRVDFSGCKPFPGCYYVTFQGRVTSLQCY